MNSGSTLHFGKCLKCKINSVKGQILWVSQSFSLSKN